MYQKESLQASSLLQSFNLSRERMERERASEGIALFYGGSLPQQPCTQARLSLPWIAELDPAGLMARPSFGLERG